jgi:hypothetical protein
MPAGDGVRDGLGESDGDAIGDVVGVVPTLGPDDGLSSANPTMATRTTAATAASDLAVPFM